MRGRGRLCAALVSAALVLAAGCGIATDDAPRELPEADVPFGLLAPESTTTTMALPARHTVSVRVFLVGAGNRLVAVVHEVPAPPGLSRALTALLDGPTEAESAGGLRSAISDQTRVLDVAVERRVATIDLGGGFTAIGGQEQILALAQFVFTATEQPAVDAVRFTLEGDPVEVPRGDGTLTQQPLRREDFAILAPL